MSTYGLRDMAEKYLPRWDRFDGQSRRLSKAEVEYELELLNEQDRKLLLDALERDGGEGVTLQFVRDPPKSANA